MKYLGVVLFLAFLSHISCNVEISKELSESTFRFVNLLKEFESLDKVDGRADQFRITAEANDYFDQLFDQLKTWLIKNGYDPMKIPDLEKSFSWKIVLVTVHGELKFTKGWLNDLATIHRVGNATIKYENKLFNVRVPIAFSTLLFDYQYSAKFMNLGPSGGLDGRLEDFSMYIDILLDLEGLELILQDFEVVSVGKLSLKWSGHGLVDWFINIITKVATTFLQGIITGIIEGTLENIIEDTLNAINADLQNFLN